MKKSTKFTTAIFTLLISLTMGACATSSKEKAAPEGFDKGKKLLDKSIKRDKSYSIDTSRVYTYVVTE